MKQRLDGEGIYLEVDDAVNDYLANEDTDEPPR